MIRKILNSFIMASRDGRVPGQYEDDDSSTTASENHTDDELIEEEVQERTQHMLQEFYRDRRGVDECKSVARDVHCAVRDHLVSKVKFVDATNKKTFPSFMYHDFTDTNHYLTKFVDEHLNYEGETLQTKAEFWITYAKTVKREVATHRATCAAAMKEAFLTGMCTMRILILETNMITSRRALTFVHSRIQPQL